jgi:cystathionine beta-lyase family protein involved in aluminum resistance
MGCDYYVQSELVIEYIGNNGVINTLYTNRVLKKCYLNSSYSDSDDDYQISYEKRDADLDKLIKENTFNKILFEKDKWIKSGYQEKYENYLLKNHHEIKKIIKIYKKINAWRRN